MTATLIRKADIVAILHSRGKHARADWFERQLPEVVDTGKNSSLLATLEIDPTELSEAGRLPPRA
ncbi:hypothetical protein ACTOB_006096 [Actinoplanes oblitus]|uniref:Uncharacterized protein n=1 Tax=Actinoplanes oblitus TaxID=3040509 RepID=A0ABY8WED8_9ACTN|nr:hypothetical protein [Actinoplanes oblitus]WIM94095.1 hypothetical protein ACTOB_006096 [Actinoplanes oblitus]